LYWECHRRTDLIRFNRFTESTYLWPWKANIANGAGVAPHYKLYPIPASELTSNKNLVQNPGY
jgi:starch-binding outer membrane protein, SusD/RagB family